MHMESGPPETASNILSPGTIKECLEIVSLNFSHIRRFIQNLSSHSLCHIDIGFPPAVCIRQNSDNRKPDFFIKFKRITRDSPCQNLNNLVNIRIPTLVLANRQDPIHPFRYGEKLAKIIPHAELREITSKSTSREQHAADVQRFIIAFMQMHFGIHS